MNELSDVQSNEKIVRRVLWLLFIVTLAMVAGRIAVVSSKDGLVPFLSANDRSRWCTVAALVEDGTYRIDRQIQITATDPKIKRDVRTWQTIDRVRHQGTDGLYHDYSSKPPLFPTMIAGLYGVIYFATGMALTEHPFYVGRLVLAGTNLSLLALFLLPVLSLIRVHGRTVWGRVFTAAGACFGTMLLPFSVSLNNHLPAAAGAAFALWVLADPQRSSRFGWMFLAGMAAAFMAANELPAASMLALFGLLALIRSPSRACLGFVPGIVLVAVAFFGTNWLAHRSLRPAYAHRGNGPLIAEILKQEEDRDFPDAIRIRDALVAADETIVERMGILNSEDEDRWMAVTESGNQRYAVLTVGDQWQIRQWDDWYEYERSYWTGDRRSGIDKGEASRGTYLFNMTFGHHGLFSLTPIWLLSIGGLFLWMRPNSLGRLEEDKTAGASRGMTDTEMRFAKLCAVAIAVASLVCVAFYTMRPLIDRNYGGVSASLRWMMWFAPLWIWLMIPMADSLAKSHWKRSLAGILLGLSCFSAVSVLENPWQHPWLYRFWDYLGWIGS
ncbi:hypothetical protein FF011L_43930 [Roseimaritima multifibrata]|uniref:Glycosyltransferase RgtA/B/C/D-like domain-containing protein n=1 Tax=Roseimaritima multifibrata TaxID=1930274 RepID=A0A517ML20_9BACT|nr:hypothetical protein [Roseimaritima multifibrata]QDS95595.1 hypothetical protein FF011L_43930 [Roseimaritima multifibrata]